jgi:hypothetical protein
MIDQRLEALLTRTARGVDYPPAPDLRTRVVAAVAASPAPRTRMPRPAFALVLLAALIVVAALAITPSRDAIARLFGVEGSKIEFLPTPLPGEIATPFPTPRATSSPGPQSISPLELDRLPELAGFEAALPDVAQERIESALLFYGRDAVTVHSYADFDLWQSRLEGHASFGKQVRPEGTVDDVKVNGVPGRWVTGAEHIVSYTDRSGVHIPASQRIVERSTLIWRTDAFFYRIETDLSLQEALRIAETLP